MLILMSIILILVAYSPFAPISPLDTLGMGAGLFLIGIAEKHALKEWEGIVGYGVQNTRERKPSEITYIGHGFGFMLIVVSVFNILISLV